MPRETLGVRGLLELVVPLERVPAGGVLIALDLAERRHLRAAVLRHLVLLPGHHARLGAARVEGAAGRWIDRRGNVALKNDALGDSPVPVSLRHRGEQSR